MTDSHEVRQPNDWDREFYCGETGEALSFEKDMGYEFCPYCGAELIFT